MIIIAVRRGVWSCLLRGGRDALSVVMRVVADGPVIGHDGLLMTRVYGKPFSQLIHNCRYLYLNTEISISITDICN